MGALQFPALDAAIAAFESGGNPNSAPSLAMNPGAIQSGTFATQHGATGSMAVAGGQSIATFPDAATGTAAQDSLVAKYAAQGDTVQQLIQNWSVGPNGTPTQTTANYVTSVVAAVPGATASTPVSQLAGVASGVAATTTGTCGITNPSACFAGFSWGRVAAFALGIVAVIGAIILLHGDAAGSGTRDAYGALRA
jgi:hypothetical protein